MRNSFNVVYCFKFSLILEIYVSKRMYLLPAALRAAQRDGI